MSTSTSARANHLPSGLTLQKGSECKETSPIVMSLHRRQMRLLWVVERETLGLSAHLKQAHVTSFTFSISISAARAGFTLD